MTYTSQIKAGRSNQKKSNKKPPPILRAVKCLIAYLLRMLFSFSIFSATAILIKSLTDLCPRAFIWSKVPFLNRQLMRSWDASHLAFARLFASLVFGVSILFSSFFVHFKPIKRALQAFIFIRGGVPCMFWGRFKCVFTYYMCFALYKCLV